MAFDPEAKKSRARRTSAEGETDTGVTVVEPIGFPQQRQQASGDVTAQLTVLFQELLLKIHELSFEVATLEDEEMRNSPLVQRCMEVLKVTKKINEYIKAMARPVAS